MAGKKAIIALPDSDRDKETLTDILTRLSEGEDLYALLAEKRLDQKRYRILLCRYPDLLERYQNHQPIEQLSLADMIAKRLVNELQREHKRTITREFRYTEDGQPILFSETVKMEDNVLNVKLLQDLLEAINPNWSAIKKQEDGMEFIYDADSQISQQ